MENKIETIMENNADNPAGEPFAELKKESLAEEGAPEFPEEP